MHITCAGPFVGIISLKLLPFTVRKACLHFTEVETEVQKGQVTAGHTTYKWQSWQGTQVVDSSEKQPLGLTRAGMRRRQGEMREEQGRKGPGSLSEEHRQL